MERVSTLVSKSIASTLTNIQTWGGIIYNVKNYGAEGDGTIDDTVAIQAAIDAAAIAGGGIVRFPAGTFIITGTAGHNFLELKSNVRLEGSGRDTTILKLGTVAGLSNALIAIVPNASDTSVCDMTIDGNSFAAEMQYAIYAYENNYYTCIKNVEIRNFHATLGHIYLYNSFYGRVEDCLIHASATLSQHGIRLVSSTITANYHTVKDCVISNGGFAFSVIKSSRNNFENCTARSDSITTSLEGFNIDGGQNNNFDNCSAYNRGDAGYIETDIDALAVPVGNRVTGFTAVGNKLNGINIAGKNGIYTNLIAQNNGADGSSVSQTFGVVFVTGADRNVVSDVFAYDDQGVHTQTHGFLIQSGATRIMYDNIQGYGNSAALLQDQNTTITSGEIKFHAHNNSVNVNIPNAAETTIAFTNTDYNVGSCYDAATGRFTPTKAGFYWIHVRMTYTSSVDQTQVASLIFKNGASVESSSPVRASGSSSVGASCVSLVYANGTTDYFQAATYQDSGGVLVISGGVKQSRFEAFYYGG